MNPEEEREAYRKYGWIAWTLWGIGLVTIIAFFFWLLMVIR